MITLVISACLIADPRACQDYRLPLFGTFSSQQCAESALPHFAKWAADHPGLEIRRWRCTNGEDI